MEEHPSPPNENHVFLFITIIAMIGVLLVLAEDLVGGILQVLGDWKFLRGFGLMLLEVVFASLLGGGVGAALGAIISYNVWLTQAAIRFLRIGLWLPFFVFWALPIWGLGKTDRIDAIFWLTVLTISVVAVFPTVVLSTCYYFLSTRFTFGAEWRKARPQVIREIILQTFFISLLSQIWIYPYGWDWLNFPLSRNASEGFTVLILLVAFLFFLELVFRSSFSHTAGIRGTILVRELTSRNWSSLLGAMALAVGCVILWVFFSEPLRKYFLISSPLKIFKTGYVLLTSGGGKPHVGEPIWQHIGVSLLEIFGGIGLAGAAALVVYKGLCTSDTLRKAILPVLPLTYLAPTILWLFLFLLPPEVRVILWHTGVAVTCLTFFSLVHVMWGLFDHPRLCRFLMALDEALPFAFVAVFIGERYAATAGLGFFVVVADATLLMDEALTTSLVTVALLLGLSSTLRWVVKRLYFSEGGVPVLIAKEEQRGGVTDV